MGQKNTHTISVTSIFLLRKASDVLQTKNELRCKLQKRAAATCNIALQVTEKQRKLSRVTGL